MRKCCSSEIVEDFDSLSFHHVLSLWIELKVLILTVYGLEVATCQETASIELHHRFFPVDTSLIHIESRKSPTKSLLEWLRRIPIVSVNTKEYHSDVLGITQGLLLYLWSVPVVDPPIMAGSWNGIIT
ncbi:hypothetical protein Tco_0829248 [Tanacetum coccineum]